MMEELQREPCPYRILEDCGAAFMMGCIGGGIFHSIRGFRNSPKGARMRGCVTAVKARAPVLGGNFGVWGGMFSFFDCALIGLRGKEDPWNAITSGAITGGILAARGGGRSAAFGFISGGIILALIEGVGIGVNRMAAQQFKPVMPQLPDPQQLPPPPSSQSRQ